MVRKISAFQSAALIRFCADICWRVYITAKSTQWTGELVGKMHNAGITAKQLATQLGKNPKYVSQVLNGHYSPKKSEEEFNTAFLEILKHSNQNPDL